MACQPDNEKRALSCYLDDRLPQGGIGYDGVKAFRDFGESHPVADPRRRCDRS